MSLNPALSVDGAWTVSRTRRRVHPLSPGPPRNTMPILCGHRGTDCVVATAAALALRGYLMMRARRNTTTITTEADEEDLTFSLVGAGKVPDAMRARRALGRLEDRPGAATACRRPRVSRSGLRSRPERLPDAHDSLSDARRRRTRPATGGRPGSPAPSGTLDRACER